MDRTSDADLHLFDGRVGTAPFIDSGRRAARTRRRAAASRTVDRLTVHALSCALHADLDQTAAVDALLDIAAGNRSAVLRAVRRIDRPGRPRTPTVQRAALLLRQALVEGLWTWGGAPHPPEATGAGTRLSRPPRVIGKAAKVPLARAHGS